MKKIILVLTTIAFIFVTGSAFGATIQCHMDNNQPGLLYGPLPGIFDFKIEIDDTTDAIISFTGLLPGWVNREANGGWNTDDGAPFSLNEQVFKTANTYDMSTINFDGFGSQTSGHGHWWRYPDSSDLQLWSVGIFSDYSYYDSSTGTGQIWLGPTAFSAEAYIFTGELVPIPSAVWLLGSGIIGLIGFCRKFRKENGQSK